MDLFQGKTVAATTKVQKQPTNAGACAEQGPHLNTYLCGSFRYGGNMVQTLPPTSVRGAMPDRVKTSSQTELQMADAALQVPECRECLGPLSEARKDSPVPQKMCHFGEATLSSRKINQRKKAGCTVFREKEI